MLFFLIYPRCAQMDKCLCQERSEETRNDVIILAMMLVNLSAARIESRKAMISHCLSYLY